MKITTPFPFPALGLLLSAFGLEALRADCVTPPAQLVSWWRAENNALDSSATNHGTLQNGTSFATGKVGHAFSFDGTNDYVQLNNAPQNPFPTSGFTYECWIQPDAQPGARKTLISNHQTSGNWWNGISVIDQSIEVTLQNGSTGGWVIWRTTATIPTNQLSHLAVAYQYSGVAANDLQIYFDGAPQVVTTSVRGGDYASGFAPGYHAGDALGFVLGRTQEDTPGGYFSGKLDELSFYSRVLSAAEIAGIFAAGSAGKCDGLELNIAPLPGSVRLSWTTNAIGFLLETNSALTLPAGWGVLTSNYSVIETNHVVTNALGGATRFFRLHKP